MNRVTLYWDDGGHAVWYKNKLGVWRTGGYGYAWRDSINQHWESGNFKKSLTINNFKEK